MGSDLWLPRRPLAMVVQRDESVISRQRPYSPPDKGFRVQHRIIGPKPSQALAAQVTPARKRTHVADAALRAAFHQHQRLPAGLKTNGESVPWAPLFTTRLRAAHVAAVVRI